MIYRGNQDFRVQTQWWRSYNYVYYNNGYTILQIYSIISVTNKIVQTLAPELTALSPKCPVSYNNLKKCLIAQNDSLYSIKCVSARALTFQQQEDCKHSNICQAPSRWHRNVGLTVPQTDNPMWRGTSLSKIWLAQT